MSASTLFKTLALALIIILLPLCFTAQSFSFGVNLAGAEFGDNYVENGVTFIDIPGTLGQQYIYPNEAEMDYYHLKGLDLIRLPFIWERVQNGLNGGLNQLNINEVKQVLQWASERNMEVLLDLHNSCRYQVELTSSIIGDGTLTINHVVDLWTKLADELKNEPAIWGYGIMNEPHDMLASTPWFDIAQAIVTGIRTVDTETTIVIGGDRWSSAEHWVAWSDNLKNIVDPSNDIIYEAHIYFDDDASGQYLGTYDEELGTPSVGVIRATPFVEWLQANNLRGFIGEYGIPDNDPRWLTTLDNMLAYLEGNCVNGTYWAGGPRWGPDFMAIDPVDGTGESDPLNGAERPQMAIVQNHTLASNICFDVAPTIEVAFNLKAMLQGPLIDDDQQMSDLLRSQNLLPLNEPYTNLGFAHFIGGGEQISQSVLSNLGENSIVDWIFIELRDFENPTSKIATQTALIQKDGDIVGLDGVSNITFNIDEYYTSVYVVVRHRNHFDIRTLNTYPTNGLICIDFTDFQTPIFNTNSVEEVSGIVVLLSGDSNHDGVVNTVDKNSSWQQENSAPFNYLNSRSDFNLDGAVNTIDRNLYWRVNNTVNGGMD